MLGRPRPASPHCRFSKSRVAYEIGGRADSGKPPLNACLDHEDRLRIIAVGLSLRLRAKHVYRGNDGCEWLVRPC